MVFLSTNLPVAVPYTLIVRLIKIEEQAEFSLSLKTWVRWLLEM